MKPRLKSIFVIPHLGGGGAQRVFSLLATNLADRGHQIHLAVLKQGPTVPGLLPSSVVFHRLGATRVRYAAAGLLRLVWQVKPDAVISGMFHLNLLVLLVRGLFPRSTAVLVRQNGDPSAGSPGFFSSWIPLIYRLLYKRADAIICQHQDMANEFQKILHHSDRICVAPNPVDLQSIRKTRSTLRSPWTSTGPNLLAVGRLSQEKGVDLLLGAFRKICAQFPAAVLTILGSGPDEQTLRLKCTELGIAPAVHFMGYVEEPCGWFDNTTLFVCPSRSDAMPNAVLEAAAAGLPIVCTPASKGLVTLLHGRRGVWLSEEISVESLARSLRAALETLPPKQRFEHHWIERHDLEKVTDRYEDLIYEAVGNPIACSTSLLSSQR